MTHVAIAAKQGMKAGMRSYLDTLRNSGLEAVRDAYAQEWGVLNAKQQFEHYCAKFGTVVDTEKVATRTTRSTPRSTPKSGIDAQIENARKALAKLENDARIAREQAAREARAAAKAPKAPKAPRSTPSTTTGTITAGQAWVMLGSNPEFKPSDLTKPASGQMLWRLNTQGKLAA